MMWRVDVRGRGVVTMCQWTLDELKRSMAVNWPDRPVEDPVWDMVGTPVMIDAMLRPGHVVFRNAADIVEEIEMERNA